MRPRQWAKNLLVLAPFLFGADWSSSAAQLGLLKSFVALCLISSSIYIFNDYRDQEKDRNHPKKQHRPFAAGKANPVFAFMISAACLSIGFAMASLTSPVFWQSLLACFTIQYVYNMFAKQVAVLDLVVISLGYVIRPIVGAAAIGVPISGWLVFCTGAVALLLAAAKRRHEFITLGQSSKSRLTLASYNLKMLDALLLLGATISVLSYGIYAIESPTAIKHPLIILTIPLVTYGVLRYLFLTYRDTPAEEPEIVVFTDPHLVATLVIFVATAAFAMTQTASL